MKERILSLLKSIPKAHPLSQILESKLLPELLFAIEISGAESKITSEYRHFTAIYKRRYYHLLDEKIENYGILESVAYMKAHPGSKRTASIQTQKFTATVWTDPNCKELIGLVLVNRLQADERRWKRLQARLKEKPDPPQAGC